jgi:hypothetical protein
MGTSRGLGPPPFYILKEKICCAGAQKNLHRKPPTWIDIKCLERVIGRYGNGKDDTQPSRVENCRVTSAIVITLMNRQNFLFLTSRAVVLAQSQFPDIAGNSEQEAGGDWGHEAQEVPWIARGDLA